MINPSNTIVTNENSKVRYALAKASTRILARIVDILILLVLIVPLEISIVATDPAGLKAWLELKETWRYFLIFVLPTIIFSIYFLLISFLLKGRTVALFLFKLRIYNLIPTKNFFVNLVKREFCLWIITCITNFVLGISLWTMQTNDASIFLKNILLQTSQSNDKQIGVIIFQALYLVSACILLFVIIHMFINNKRRCLIDHISDTVMIKLVDINGKDSNLSSNNKIIKHKRNYGLPGEIVASIEDEIDSL